MGEWGGWASYLLFCILKAIHMGVVSMLGAAVIRTPLVYTVVVGLFPRLLLDLIVPSFKSPLFDGLRKGLGW